MFGLPKSTELNKPLPKKALYDKFRPNAAMRRRFDEEISRMAIVAEISPQTVNIAAGAQVAAIYVVLVTLKTPECSKRNLALLAKLIDQRMIFALQHGDTLRLAVYRAERVLISASGPLEGWTLRLSGLTLDAVWENTIAEIAGIAPAKDNALDEAILVAEQRARLERQIDTLEKKTRREDQPRRKMEYFERLQRLKRDLATLQSN